MRPHTGLGEAVGKRKGHSKQQERPEKHTGPTKEKKCAPKGLGAWHGSEKKTQKGKRAGTSEGTELYTKKNETKGDSRKGGTGGKNLGKVKKCPKKPKKKTHKAGKGRGGKAGEAVIRDGVLL